MASTSLSRTGISAERRFYLGMLLLIVAIMFVGFAPNFYLRGLVPVAVPPPPITAMVLLHGLLFTTWLLLFAAQVGLVSVGRIGIHRRLGLAAFAMLPAMIVVAVLTVLYGVARQSVPPGIPPLAWLAVPLFDVPVFAALISAALWQRPNPQAHKRLMLSATIALTPPGVARIAWLAFLPMPVVIIGSQALLMALLAIWDLRSRGRLHPVTVFAAVLIIASWLLRFAIWQTGPWLAFAAWAVALVA